MRLDQVLGQGAAVDGDERFAGSIRGAVHGAGDHFLAHPALAQDQHRNLRLGRPLAHALDLGHGGGRTDQIGEGETAADLLFQPVDLGGEVAHLQGVADRHQDAFGRGGLDEEVLGAGLHGLDHHVHPAGGREHDHRLHEAARAHFLEGVHARQPGHHQVEDHRVGARAGDQLRQGLIATLRLSHRETFALQHRLDQAALGRIVIDDKDRFGHEEHTAIQGPRRYRHGLFWDGYAPRRVKVRLRRD